MPSHHGCKGPRISFFQIPFGLELRPSIRRVVDGHRRVHVAFLFATCVRPSGGGILSGSQSLPAAERQSASVTRRMQRLPPTHLHLETRSHRQRHRSAGSFHDPPCNRASTSRTSHFLDPLPVIGRRPNHRSTPGPVRGPPSRRQTARSRLELARVRVVGASRIAPERGCSPLVGHHADSCLRARTPERRLPWGTLQ